MALSPPELLAEYHNINGFDCGTASLNDWLQKRARANQESGASRSYVVAQAGRVVGYYCLSSGALATTQAPGKLRRNMPDPIPMAILGRLAVDQDWQANGIGVALLQDAVLRVGQAAHILGIRGILVHAISEEAKRFYERHGFTSAPNQPMILVLSVRQPVTQPETQQ